MDDNRAEVEAVAREVVETLRPAEAPMFDFVSEAYWRAGGREPGGAGGIGFDAAAAAQAITPAALAVAGFALALLPKILERIGMKAADGLYDALAALLSGEARPAAAGAPAPVAEAVRLADLVREEARRVGPARSADAIADAVLARLVRDAAARGT